MCQVGQGAWRTARGSSQQECAELSKRLQLGRPAGEHGAGRLTESAAAVEQLAGQPLHFLHRLHARDVAAGDGARVPGLVGLCRMWAEGQMRASCTPWPCGNLAATAGRKVCHLGMCHPTHPTHLPHPQLERR